MQEFEEDINNSIRVLINGGLILYPTDTVWGIGCDATNAAAVKKIYALKKRADEKSMIILMTDKKDILKYITAPDPRVFEYLDNANKPTTIIYEGSIGLADNVINSDGTVGIRLVQDLFCRQLIKRFRKPIVSTSANISGESTPAIFNEVSDTIKNGVDFIVQHRRNDFTLKEPSAVVKLNSNGTFTVLRP